MVRVARIELARPCKREILSLLCLPISPYSLSGAPEESRTPRILLLRQARIPVPSPAHILVLPRGIEPRSTVLQTAAMTTSAKVAWYTVTGSNRRPSPCKGVALPLS